MNLISWHNIKPTNWLFTFLFRELKFYSIVFMMKTKNFSYWLHINLKCWKYVEVHCWAYVMDFLQCFRMSSYWAAWIKVVMLKILIPLSVYSLLFYSALKIPIWGNIFVIHITPIVRMKTRIIIWILNYRLMPALLNTNHTFVLLSK